MTAKYQFLALSKILNRFNDGESLDLTLLDSFSLEPNEKEELVRIDRRRLALDRRKRKDLYILKIKNDYPFLGYFIEQQDFFDTFLNNYADFEDDNKNSSDRILRFLHKYDGRYQEILQNLGYFEEVKQKLVGGNNFKLQKIIPSVINKHKLPERAGLKLNPCFNPVLFGIDILEYLKAFFTKSHAEIKQTERYYIFYNEKNNLSFFEISRFDFILLKEFKDYKRAEQGVESSVKMAGIPSVRSIIISQLRFFFSIGVLEQADEKL